MSIKEEETLRMYKNIVAIIFMSITLKVYCFYRIEPFVESLHDKSAQMVIHSQLSPQAQMLVFKSNLWCKFFNAFENDDSKIFEQYEEICYFPEKNRILYEVLTREHPVHGASLIDWAVENKATCVLTEAMKRFKEVNEKYWLKTVEVILSKFEAVQMQK